METQSKYTHEQIQEWQKANNMEVFSLAQLCAILMKFEERQNEMEKAIIKIASFGKTKDEVNKEIENIKEVSEKYNISIR